MTDPTTVTERTKITGVVTAHRWVHPPASVACAACKLAIGVPRACPDHQPHLAAVDRTRNLIVDTGLNLIRDALEDTTLNAGIRYMSWGTDGTTPDAGDTTLGSESGRKAITSWTDGTVGVKTTTVYLAPEDANITIAEFGWHATSTATATTDSGVLYAHSLYPGGSHAKTNLESIQLDREDTFA